MKAEEEQSKFTPKTRSQQLNNFVQAGGSQDGWLISRTDFSSKVLAALFDTVLLGRTGLDILIPGVGLDETCFDLEALDAVESITLVDLDVQSAEFFHARRTEPKKNSAAITDKISFYTSWEALDPAKKFDVVLDKSFFDVLEAAFSNKQADAMWQSYTRDRLAEGGVCIVLSMNLQRAQSALRSAFACAFFSVLFDNNQYTYARLNGGRNRKRGGIVSLGLAFHGACPGSTMKVVQAFSGVVAKKFHQGQPQNVPFKHHSGQTMDLVRVKKGKLHYTNLDLKSRESG